jgi:hypothetical protein
MTQCDSALNWHFISQISISELFGNLSNKIGAFVLGSPLSFPEFVCRKIYPLATMLSFEDLQTQWNSVNDSV